MIFGKLIKREEDVIHLIAESLKHQNNILITYFNQHSFNIYNSNAEYKKLLDDSFKVFLDGFGIYAALKLWRYSNVEKFNATDLYERIFENFSTGQTRLFLIGGNFSDKYVSEKALENRINLCGYHKGYFNNDEIVSIVDSINSTTPEVIIIGMGVPKQEILASEIAELIQNKVILCVGGCLEFYFGTKKRAPGCLRKIGFEWLHRLFSEPKRMWKRYIIGIPLFFFQILKLKFSSPRKDYQK
jgi:N-acetylglucosaminyldiphosphoundecaprenol N-acetyl-beta-D-mannosaminyltransferase